MAHEWEEVRQLGGDGKAYLGFAGRGASDQGMGRGDCGDEGGRETAAADSSGPGVWGEGVFGVDSAEFDADF